MSINQCFSKSEAETLSNFLESILSDIRQRLRNPFIPAFIFSWCCWNWDFFVYLLDDDLNARAKVRSAYGALHDGWYLLTAILMPLLSAMAYVCMASRVAKWVYQVQKGPIAEHEQDRAEQEKARLNSQIEVERLMNELRNERQKSDEGDRSKDEADRMSRLASELGTTPEVASQLSAKGFVDSAAVGRADTKELLDVLSKFPGLETVRDELIGRLMRDLSVSNEVANGLWEFGVRQSKELPDTSDQDLWKLRDELEDATVIEEEQVRRLLRKYEVAREVALDLLHEGWDSQRLQNHEGPDDPVEEALRRFTAKQAAGLASELSEDLKGST